MNAGRRIIEPTEYYSVVTPNAVLPYATEKDLDLDLKKKTTKGDGTHIESLPINRPAIFL